MAEPTLLSMTQDILSALSSDEVNSISDTTESLQVATIIKTKYYDLIARGDLPEHDEIFQLTASTNALEPTLMFIPNQISKLKWVKYFDTNPKDSTVLDQYQHDLNTDIVSRTNWTTTSSSTNTIATGTQVFVVPANLPITIGQSVLCTSGPNSMFGTVVSYAGPPNRVNLTLTITSTVGSGTYSSWVLTASASASIPGYKYVTVIPIEQFMEMINMFNPVDANVASYVFAEAGENFTLYYKTDKQPQWCTVLSNEYVLFDSFDSTQESTLQASKSMCFGQTVPTFVMTDSFVPPLNDQQFPLLMNEAKALAYFELKQIPHVKAEQEIKRQWSVVQKNKSISGKPTPFDALPNFGRVPRTGGYGNGSPIYQWMRSR